MHCLCTPHSKSRKVYLSVSTAVINFNGTKTSVMLIMRFSKRVAEN